jgi:hypothetical protein
VTIDPDQAGCCNRAGFSNRASLVNGLLLPPRVTVLFAVEIVRRNIWFEARAPQGPQRANAVASLRPDPRSRSYLRPVGNHHIRDIARMDFDNRLGDDGMLWLRPTERFSRTPNAMKDNRELSGQRNSCLARPRSLCDRSSPVPQTGGLFDPGQDHPGSLVHQRSSQGVAAPGYPAASIDLARLILSWREPKVRAYRS